MQSHHETSRSCLTLDRGWCFVPVKARAAWLRGGGEEAGAPVVLPHCWNTQDTYIIGSVYRRGWGSYRREVALPAEPPAEAGCRWRLRSEGFYGRGELWVDGVRRARFDGEYLGLDLDVTGWLVPGRRHWVGLRLSNRHHRHVLPGLRLPDFILYGGLAGRVWLECEPVVRLQASEVRLSLQGILTPEGVVAVEAVVQGPAEGFEAWECRLEIRDAADRVVGEGCCGDREGAVRIGAGRWRLAVWLPMGAARLWSPEDPYRYTLVLRLSWQGRAMETQRIRFGCREAEFRRGQGFFLNGRHYPLRGANRHACVPGLGNALTAEVHVQDAALLRSMGLNFVRLSHYPQAPAFLDACDALGLLVYAELASWKTLGGGRWLVAARRQWERMIRRDRNRPCIIVWGMGNEARARWPYQALYTAAKRLDPRRAVSYAENHLYRARRRRTLGVPDIWGLNYEFDALEAAASASRLGVTLVTECSNYPEAARADLRAQRAQMALLAADLQRVGDRREVAGFALWSFNDYATERKRRYRRFCGLVDAWRIPKMTAVYLQAMFLGVPVLRLFCDRRLLVAGGEVEVDLVGNSEEVRLWADAGEVAVVSLAETRHAVVRVPPGTRRLRAEGRGALGGCETVLWIGGEAVGIALLLVPPRGEVVGSGEEAVRFEGRVEDAEGHGVGDWNGLVTVRCEGPAVVAQHRPDGVCEVAGGVFAGYIRRRGEPGVVTLVAEAPGLRAATCRLG